ncbi:MAG: urease accessory protein ureD [Bacillaceae bacterium]|nr:MAG: urease accessory protein ureD [Bacillaceae bacterium]
MEGILQIRAEQKGERTVITDHFFQGALKMTKPVYTESSIPIVYVIHVGGGCVDGDEYSQEISLGEKARLAVTSQSSTKIYKTPKKPVKQKFLFTLQKDSVLECLSDPLIVYEQARFEQETIVHMEKGAAFLYKEIITPGWSETGQPFCFDAIRLKLKVYKENRLILFDHFYQQGDQEIDQLLNMEGYTHYGSFLVISDGVDDKLMEKISCHLQGGPFDGRIGISRFLPSAFMIRILGNHTDHIEGLFLEVHRLARAYLLKEPPILLRKY